MVRVGLGLYMGLCFKIGPGLDLPQPGPTQTINYLALILPLNPINTPDPADYNCV